MTGQSTLDLVEKLAAIEGQLMLQTGCRAEEIAGVYNKPIAKPVVNARMGEALRARFAAENERDALRAQNAELLAALEPFANALIFGLEDITSDTMLALFFKAQLFKDASAAVTKAKGEK